MPLGAADATAMCGTWGGATKNGGEKMTMLERPTAAALAAVYSTAMRHESP